MNIILIGYGKMGKAVREVAEERQHEISAIISPHAPEAHSTSSGPDPRSHSGQATAEALKGADVAIDFSLADAAFSNVRAAAEAGVDLISGVTGWAEQLEEAKGVVEEGDIGFLWASNFSLGVNAYFRIVEYAARLMNNLEEYDVWGHEIHHRHKKDAPSGTAKKLEQIIIDNIERKKAVVEGNPDHALMPEEFHFSSTRGGEVNFEHTVAFDAPSDAIKIVHSGRGRREYALGAVKAAEWVHGKKGFFTMEDFLKGVLGSDREQVFRE